MRQQCQDSKVVAFTKHVFAGITGILWITVIVGAWLLTGARTVKSDAEVRAELVSDAVSTLEE